MLDDDKIKLQLRAFAAERNWEQFHTPRNIAASVSIEAAELLELFQWSRGEDWAELADPKLRARTEEELADLVLYLFRFADLAKIDIADACARKLAVNAQKYPVDRFHGSDRKYNEE